jgi:hypothetical protein
MFKDSNVKVLWGLKILLEFLKGSQSYYWKAIPLQKKTRLSKLDLPTEIFNVKRWPKLPS